MAHGTRINGANKAVTAGFTRIDGVNKKITKGLTLVNGVQMEIPFGSGKFTVALVSPSVAGRVSTSVGGVLYTTTTTIEAESGTVLSISVRKASIYNTYVYLNGNRVAQATSSNTWTNYTHTIESNVSVKVEGNTNIDVYITTS